jgi:hypothetical protein
MLPASSFCIFAYQQDEQEEDSMSTRIDPEGIEMRYGVAAALRGDVLMLVCYGRITPESWRWQRMLIEQAHEQTKGSIILASVIHPESGTPDITLSRQMKDDFIAFEKKIRRFVVASVRDGIFARSVRAIVRGAMVMSKQPGLQVFCEDLSNCVTLIREHASERTPSDRELREALGMLHDKLKVPTPS